MRQLLTPFPSVASGAGPFLVLDSPEGAGGCCAPPDRRRTGLFQSPFSVSSPLARGIRAHEYGHLGLWRQRLGPSLRCLRDLHRGGIHELWIQGTLDVVVNHFMMARGNRDIAQLSLWCDGLYPELPRWIAATLYIRAEGLRHAALIRMSILARQTALTGEDLAVLDETSRRLAQWGREMLPLSRRKYREMLIHLQSRFGPDSPDAEPLARIGICLTAVGGALSDGLDPHDYLVRKRVLDRRGRMQGGEARIEWGPMEILVPPLTLRCRNVPGMNKRKLVCGYTGAFRFPSRTLLPAADGRAFTHCQSRSARHGTLLIDCSGSMSEQVTQDRLMAVLARAPTTTIGLYAGRPGDRSGTLLIAARNGVHVASEVVDNWTHAGNVVDGPALAWLSRQRTPRVWVSDGEVTGLDDRTGVNLQLEVDRLTSSAHIRRVETLNDYLTEKEKQNKDRN